MELTGPTRTFEVTQQNIDEGKRHKTTCCPVALAIKWYGFKPYVTQEEIYMDNVAFDASPTLTRFIERFDAGLEVKPGKFTVTRRDK